MLSLFRSTSTPCEAGSAKRQASRAAAQQLESGGQAAAAAGGDGWLELRHGRCPGALGCWIWRQAARAALATQPRGLQCRRRPPSRGHAPGSAAHSPPCVPGRCRTWSRPHQCPRKPCCRRRWPPPCVLKPASQTALDQLVASAGMCGWVRGDREQRRARQRVRGFLGRPPPAARRCASLVPSGRLPILAPSPAVANRPQPRPHP